MPGLTGVAAQPAALLSSPSEPLLGPAAPPLPCCAGVEPPGPAPLAPPHQHPRHPALSLSPCLMEGDVSVLPGVATNVATEGWGVQPVDKTVAEHSGVDGVRLRCVQLGGQHQQVLRVPHYTLPHPLPPAVERGEQSREAPVVAEGCCEDRQNLGRCVCLPCGAGEHLPPGRSLQSLDQPLHCCPFLHPEVPEDALRLLNKFIGVAAIRLSSEAC